MKVEKGGAIVSEGNNSWVFEASVDTNGTPEEVKTRFQRAFSRVKKKGSSLDESAVIRGVVFEVFDMEELPVKAKKKTYQLIGVKLTEAEKIAKYLRATPLLEAEVRRSIAVVDNGDTTAGIYSETKPDKELKEKVKQLVALIQA